MWDRPPAQWPRDENGQIGFFDSELDLELLLTELPPSR